MVFGAEVAELAASGDGKLWVADAGWEAAEELMVVAAAVLVAIERRVWEAAACLSRKVSATSCEAGGEACMTGSTGVR